MSRASSRQLLESPHFWIGLALIAIFWPAAWLHWGLLGEYAFFPLWLGYILTVDALVACRRGSSLLTRRPGLFLALFALSAPVWWIFEGGNNFTLNWHYLVDKPYSPLHIIVESTIDFSTVIPAVFETASLVLTFDFVRRWQRPGFRHPLSHGWLWFLMYVGAFMFLAAILFPTVAFPFIWTWLFLLVDPLNALCGRPSLLEQASRGDFRAAGALGIGVLICAFFWEMWNYYSMPKWFYTVPYFDNKIFEMPAAGYLGYIPFSWELYALYQYIVGLLRIRNAGSPLDEPTA